jgi:predicted ferric reductase
MITQPEVSASSNLRPFFDLAVIALGMLAGGVIALVSLWLWLDYHHNAGHSLLANFSGYAVALLPTSWQLFFSREAHLIGLPLAGETKAYWYMARSGGLVAYGLLWLSVAWGLVLSTKITDRLVPAPIAFGLHEFLSLGSVIFGILHALVLQGDRYFDFNILHLLIPFTAPYEPFWTGLGVIALYLTAALTGSFYLRHQIGQKSWRRLHYLTFGVYVMALFHGLMAGTDTRLDLMRLMYLVTGASILFLTYYRLLTLRLKRT